MTARGRLLSVLVATVIALAGFVTVGAPAVAAGPTGTLQYVALGDSYAAGIGAPPYDIGDDKCDRSSKGYPALLDPKGRIDLQVNATCPGFTTTDVADLVASSENPLNEGTELVTLTVGGNDLGFRGLAGACLAGTPQLCQVAIDAAKVQVDRLRSTLPDLYRQLASAAPNALIVVTGYPHLVESTAPFPPALIDLFNAATDELNSAIEDAVFAVDRDNIVYVDVVDAFAGHGIGAEDDPFINAPAPNQPLSQEAFHPNAAGYRAYAKAISAAIRDALKQLA